MSYYKTNKGILKEEYDEDTLSPRLDDCISTFYTFSRNYKSPDNTKLRSFVDFLQEYGAMTADSYYSEGKVKEGNEAMVKALDKKGYVALPVYKYEHTGCCYQASMTNPFHDDWDSCLIGVIFSSKKKLLEEFGSKRVGKKLREKAIELMKSEVEEYSSWANGECYYYELHDEDGNEIDSCCGFIGDIKDNGVLIEFGITEYEYIGEDYSLS